MFNFGKVKKLEEENIALKSLLNNKDYRIKEQQEEIEILKHNELILLQNAEALRKEKADLENNVEFLFNNLTPKKRKLIRPES